MEENTKSLSAWETRQKNLFDRIAGKFESHYSDKYSQQYRKTFFYDPMTKNLPLADSLVLEAMCGSGQMTQYLLAKGARVTGLDISDKQIDAFKRQWPDSEAICRSILNSELENASFDAVMVVAGLHHLHPHVEEAIDEIHRVLKPRGYFCFVEPHARSWPDQIRRQWYRLDPYFEKNEAAINLKDLEAKNFSRFDFMMTKYGGNVAYLAVYNSLILRLPLFLKRLYSPLALIAESGLNSFQGKKLSCFVICQWRKK